MLVLLNAGLLALNVGFVAATGNPVSVAASTFIGVCIVMQLASIVRTRP